jgi:hypothetical protein
MLARAACATWEGTENEPMATDTEVCLPDDPTAFKGHGSSLIARRLLSPALNEFSGRCAGHRSQCAGKYGLSRDSLACRTHDKAHGDGLRRLSSRAASAARPSCPAASRLEPGIQAAPSVIIRGCRTWMYVSSPCMTKTESAALISARRLAKISFAREAKVSLANWKISLAKRFRFASPPLNH